MKIKERTRHLWLLAPLLLLAGVQMFAQATGQKSISTDVGTSQGITTPRADLLRVVDRSFMKSIAGLVTSGKRSCASSTVLEVGAGSFPQDRCPIIDCPAPPPGCAYQSPDTDARGCQINCGQLVCGLGAD